MKKNYKKKLILLIDAHYFVHGHQDLNVLSVLVWNVVDMHMMVYFISKVHVLMLSILYGGNVIIVCFSFLKMNKIFSGEVKITMDPLLHWLQYPYFLPQSDPMRQ